MEIDALSDQTETAYAFNIKDDGVRWNGRDIRELEGMSTHATIRTLLIKHEANRSLTQCKIHREPNMSRPPDESEASVEAGYDEKRGAFVEGKWTWTWNDKDDRETSSDGNQGTAPSDPPDSGDRDFDKDTSNN